MSTLPTTTIEQALRDWVILGTGLADARVIWSDQAGPRPAAPYAELKLDGHGGNGQDWPVITDNILEIVDTLVEPDNTADTLAAVAHTLQTGDGPVRLETAGTPPTGLAEDTDYWIIRIDADTIQLASSLVNANALTPITFSDDGAGALTLVGTETTTRILQGLAITVTGERVAILRVTVFGGSAVGEPSPGGRLNRLRASADLPEVVDSLNDAEVGVLGVGAVSTIGGAHNKIFEPRAIVEIRLSGISELATTGNFIERLEGEIEVGDDTIPFTQELP